MVILLPRQRAVENRATVNERKRVGERLRNARKSAGLTAEQAATQVGVIREAVTKWEHGDNYPTPDRLQRLADLYSVSVDWLMGREKRIGETPAVYLPGQPPITEEEARLALEFIQMLRRQRRESQGGEEDQ